MVRNYSFSGRINGHYNCRQFNCDYNDTVICDKAAVCNKGLQFAIDDRLSHMKEYGGIDATIDEVDSFFGHVDVYAPLYGGRMPGSMRGGGHEPNMSEENIKWLNDKGIGVKLTLTNPHFKIEKYERTKELLDKYSNTKNYNIDNKWIEHESYIWDNIIENISHINHLRFLGGEAFANKQHNIFLKKLSTLDARKKISIHYVTNATLITKKILNYLSKIQRVELAISLDAPKLAGEFFRFPITWKTYMNTVKLIYEYTNNTSIKPLIQWTCSNVSMFYLIESYDLIKNNFSNLTFWLCNHVESPLHMSAKVLPMQLKEKICNDIDKHVFDELCQERIRFYVDHMMEEDLWPTEGKVFMNYLDDLSKARNIDWRINLKEMELDRYDPR